MEEKESITIDLPTELLRELHECIPECTCNSELCKKVLEDFFKSSDDHQYISESDT